MHIYDIRFLNNKFKPNLLYNLIFLNNNKAYFNYDISKNILNNIGNNVDNIICTDGGFVKYSLLRNKYPDLNLKIANAVIGDFDSVTLNNEYLVSNKINKIFHYNQNKTDSQKALEYMVKDLSLNNIIFYQINCTRVDHFFSNLKLLKQYNNKSIYYITEDYIIFLLKKGENKIIFSEYKESKNIGFVPLYEPCCIISSEGLDYNMHNFDMAMSQTFSTSNSSNKDSITIETDKEIICVLNFEY